MRTYYDGPDALITETHFVWRTAPLRAFVIVGLRDIRLVQRGMSGSRTLLPAATVAAVALIIAPGWLLVDTMGGRFALLGAAGAAVILATRNRRDMHRWELRATYQRREVVVYASLELRTFNQVTRALRRAVEQSGRRRRDSGMAAA